MKQLSIKIKNEGAFWGVFIPESEEFLVAKRLGDIKKVLFEHYDVQSMKKPDVRMFGEDEEYAQKLKDLRRQTNSTLEYKEGEVPEIIEVVGRFARAGVPIKATAEFLKTTQKRINELSKAP